MYDTSKLTLLHESRDRWVSNILPKTSLESLLGTLKVSQTTALSVVAEVADFCRVSLGSCNTAVSLKRFCRTGKKPCLTTEKRESAKRLYRQHTYTSSLLIDLHHWGFAHCTFTLIWDSDPLSKLAGSS